MRTGRPLKSSRWQQRVYQGLDLSGDTVFAKGRTDGATFSGEVLCIGQGNAGSHGFGTSGCGGKVAVKKFGVVVFGDRQGPNQIVEVTFVGLTVRLQVGDLCERGGAVEDTDQVSGFRFRPNIRPLSLVFDDDAASAQFGGAQQCAGCSVDGAFQRAMRLVPPEEAQALWGEFDAHMERVYAVWAASR